MKLRLLVIFILSINAICHSQNEYKKGEIRNLENNEPLAYVNIGIKNKTVGTVSNQNGLFNLSLNEKVTKNDTVVFSFIGFRTERYLISELKDKKISFYFNRKTQNWTRLF